MIWMSVQVRNVPSTLLSTWISVWVRSPFGCGRQGHVQECLGGSGIGERLRVVVGGCQRVGALEDHGELPAAVLRIGCPGLGGGGHEAIAEGVLVPLHKTGDFGELSGALDGSVVEGGSRARVPASCYPGGRRTRILPAVESGVVVRPVSSHNERQSAGCPL